MSDRLTSRPLPSGWETLPLGGVVSRVTQRNNVGNRNVLTISARDGLVNQEQFFNKQIASTNLSPYFLLARGDFAYNKSYSAGYPVGVMRRLDRYSAGVVSPLYICFRPDLRIVDSDYLAQYLQSGLLDDDISWIAKEGARNHGLLNVGVNDFFSIPIRVPSLGEQTYVATILNTADELIQSIEQLIAKLEQAKRGLVYDLFTLGIDQTGHLRQPRGHPGEFFESPIGLFPRGWKVSLLGEVVSKCEYGTSFPLAYGPGIAILRMNNLHHGEVDLRDVKSCLFPIPRRLLLKPGDVLFNRTNSMDQVGRTAIWRGGVEGLSFASYLVRLVHDPRVVISEYLNMWLNHPETQRQLRKYATHGVHQVNINPTNLRRILIAYPESTPEQSAICERVQAAEAELAQLRRELVHRRLLKQGLMADLLTGRVRVGASA